VCAWDRTRIPSRIATRRTPSYRPSRAFLLELVFPVLSSQSCKRMSSVVPRVETTAVVSIMSIISAELRLMRSESVYHPKRLRLLLKLLPGHLVFSDNSPAVGHHHRPLSNWRSFLTFSFSCFLLSEFPSLASTHFVVRSKILDEFPRLVVQIRRPHTHNRQDLFSFAPMFVRPPFNSYPLFFLRETTYECRFCALFPCTLRSSDANKVALNLLCCAFRCSPGPPSFLYGCSAPFHKGPFFLTTEFLLENYCQ